MKQTPARTEIQQLKNLVDGIAGDLKNSFAKVIKAGELLTKMKSTSKYGDWDDVLQAVGLTFKTAQRYMAVWEHRADINLNEIKTISDAEDAYSKIGRLPIPTTQNQPLTHEKTSNYDQDDSRVSDLHSARCSDSSDTLQSSKQDSKAVVFSGGKSPKPETINGVRKSVTGDTDNSWAYVTERDEIDPSDRVPKSSTRDVAIAREASDLYPKIVQLQVVSRQEEDEFVKWSGALIDKRTTKLKPLKLDLHEAIAKVCSTYKKTTGKTLSVKAADAGQLRRHLESGITLEEFLEVAQKAWRSNGFFARQSHQLVMFVKHYGNIRNEIENPTDQKSGRQGNDRNAGTANSKTIGQYDGIGRVV